MTGTPDRMLNTGATMDPDTDNSDNIDHSTVTSGYIKFTEVILGVAILLGLYMTSIYSYLLFHSLVEVFGIIVIVSISIIAWHSRRFIDNNYFILLGIAYLFIAAMTLLHTLAYKGMGVFTGYDANLPTQLWIATRYLESVTFLIAPLFIGRKLKMNIIFSGYAIVTGILIASIFYWNIFPDCFIEGVGLTAFKKLSEYVISLVLLFSIYLLLQKRINFDKEVLYLLIAALMLNVFAELAFTFYISVYGFSNLVGHFLRLISFYLIYKAIIEKALTKPYDLLFRSLKKNEMSLQRSNDFVQSIINSVGDPIIVIDASNYKILLANEAAQNFNDCVNPVGKSMSCYEFSHLRDTPCSSHDYSCPLRHVVNAKKPHRFIHTHYDREGNESVVDIVATPIFDDNGDVIQVIESSRDITEIKKTEKALRETHDYLEKLIDYTNAPFIVWNPEFKITRINHAFEHLTGYTSSELVYKKLDMLFPDSSMQETLSEIDRTISGEPWESVEIPILRKDGTIRLTLWNSANLYDEDGTTVLAIIAQGIDITERKQAEDALRESERRLIRAQEIAHVGDWEYDIEADMIRWSDEVYRIYGIDTATEMTYEILRERIHPDDRVYHDKYTEKLMESKGRESFEYRFMYPDGSIRHVYGSGEAICDSTGKVVRLYGIVMDITERKLAEMSLQVALEKRKELELIVNRSAVIVFLWKAEEGWPVEFVSKNIEQFGYTQQDFMGGRIPYADIIHSDDLELVGDEVSMYSEQGTDEYSQEYRIITKSGDVRWTEDHTWIRRDPDGNITHYQGIVVDVTERKQAEEKLKTYAEDLKHSNELKDMFTDILRHDLLNPAGLVKGFTEVLIERENDGDKLHALQKIEQNNKKLIDLIESAAKFAKLESTDEFEFNVKDIGTIFKDVVEDFGPILYKKQITLDFVAEGEHLANVNPIIEEVFANLLSNAIKYGSNESRIIVDILDSGEKWKVTVTDFGEGISDDDKPNVFTRFKRVGKGNVKGTGLGLAIVKKIVELHGGKVGVEDNPAGQGSVFWVTVRKG